MLRKSVAGLLTLILLGLSGCGVLGVREDPASAGGPHGRVDASGFTISAGDVTVSGPSGVAPEGTRVTMSLVEAPSDLVTLELNGSPLFDIALEGDAQPAVPVTVTWPVPAQMAADSIAFVTADGPGSPWRGIPVTVQNGLASVKMDHFTWGWFVDGQSIISNFRDAASAYFGQHHEAPPNCRPTAVVGVSEITVRATREDYVHACVTAEEGKATVTAASNSPHGFRVKVQDKAIVRNVMAGPSLESAVTLAVSRRMLRKNEDAVLVPGGRVEVTYSPSDWTGHQDVHVIGGSGDAAFGLIPIALIGVQMFTTDVPSGLADDAATIECLLSIMDGIGADSASSWGGAIPGLVGCVATAMDDSSGHLGMISAITTSLSGHLVTQVRGIIDTASGLTFAVTANTRILSRQPTTCGPDLATVRRLSEDPGGTVSRQQCTTDRRWAVSEGEFTLWGAKRHAIFIFQNQGGQWTRAARLTHQSSCYDLEPLVGSAPLQEIDRLVGGFCGWILGHLLLPGQPITTDGIGGLQVGMTVDAAIKSGYLVTSQDPCAQGYETVPYLAERGVSVQLDTRQRIAGIWINDARWQTRSGARLGMPIQELRRLYGDDLTTAPSVLSAGTNPAVVANNGNRVVFDLSGGNRVQQVIVDNVRNPSPGGC